MSIGDRVTRRSTGDAYDVVGVDGAGMVSLAPVQYAAVLSVTAEALATEFDGDPGATDDPALKPGEAEANRAAWAREFEVLSLREGVANAAHNARLAGEHVVIPESS